MEYAKERKKDGLNIPVNHLFVKSEEELRKMTNFIPKNSTSTSQPPKVSAGFGVSPTTFDYRDLNKVSSVKDQDSCGSCWSFAATAHYESLLLLSTGI